MKDEARSVIRLLNSNLHNGATFYHLQITHRSQLYTLTCRYSKLRSISASLPQTKTKFPEPRHISMVVCSLLGDKTVLEERYEALTKYFGELSGFAELSENKGFKRLLQESVQVEQPHEKSMPLAPCLRGRKIARRQCADQLLIVVG